jgi:hypothetical protein
MQAMLAAMGTEECRCTLCCQERAFDASIAGRRLVAVQANRCVSERVPCGRLQAVVGERLYLMVNAGLWLEAFC